MLTMPSTLLSIKTVGERVDTTEIVFNLRYRLKDPRHGGKTVILFSASLPYLIGISFSYTSHTSLFT